MIDDIRSERIKALSVRGNWVLITIGVLLPVVIGGLIAGFSSFEFSGPDGVYVDTVLGPSYIAAFPSATLGVLIIGQEYRHSTIRTTFAAQPMRSRVMLAKLLVTIVGGGLIGMLAMTISFVLSLGITSARGVDSPSLGGLNLAPSVGLVVLCVLYAVVGLGVGAIVRQPAGAIPIVLLWPLVVEGIVGALLELARDGLSKFLPFREGLRLPDTSEMTDFAFDRLPAGLYFAGFAALVLGIGWMLVARRDA